MPVRGAANDFDAAEYLDNLLWTVPGGRRRHGRRSRPRTPTLHLLAVGLVVAAVAVVIGGAAVIIGQPTEGAVASEITRELIIVSQPGSPDDGPDDDNASPSPSAVASPPLPRPVAGISQAAMANAVTIVEVGRELNLPRRAYVVAMVTALQESTLRNLANSAVPESLNHPHEGVFRNFDSVGLFQQRPSQGWGTVAELMDPPTAARRFYQRLLRVPDWQTMSVGAAAQAVQRSAFPKAYDKQRVRAEQVVDAIGGPLID
jgi:hypothetical protein